MSMPEAFLQAIIEAANDDAPRLAYSDWLEDNGESARAEFIRVQCRLAALDADDPERPALQRREYELLRSSVTSNTRRSDTPAGICRSPTSSITSTSTPTVPHRTASSRSPRSSASEAMP